MAQPLVYVQKKKTMLKNFWKTCWRNILKNKAFSLINIIGLAIGIAAGIIIFTILNYELSYDKFQPDYKKIYRIVTQDQYPDGYVYNEGVVASAIDAFRAKMPDVKMGAISSMYGSQVTVNTSSANAYNKKFIEQDGIFFCENNFFHVFSFSWLYGNEDVLKEPNTVVLSKQTAERYFGDWRKAIDKTVTLNNNLFLKVSGILNNVPGNSDFPLKVIVSFPTLVNNGDTYFYHKDWKTLSSNLQVYTLLPKNVSETSFTNRLSNFNKEHYTNRKAASKRVNIAQPLSNLHFNLKYGNYGNHITSTSTLWTLLLIGIFIILMACINFINLATAQAVKRSKEIGVRKVLGSNRLQLFAQIMCETAFIVLLALTLAFVIAYTFLPYLRNIAYIQESISIVNAKMFLFIAILFILITIFSGIYPAVILSGYNASLALKNKITSANVGGISLRRALVVIQFSISQVLIIATIIVVSQMNFVKHANLGYNKDAVLLLTANVDSVLISRMPEFKTQLLQTLGVQSVSFNNDAPSSSNQGNTNFAFNHKADENYSISLKLGDEDYLKTFGLQLAAGRFYNKSDTSNELVINETLVHKLGLKNAREAVDKDLRIGSQPWRKIVGVVKDFKARSLKQDIEPVAILEDIKSYGITAVKVHSSNLARTQQSIQQIWNNFYPEYAFTSIFLDENITKFYAQETQLELLYKIFACLGIFISCLGLYGLVSFMAVQKTKEVGVRKVLGASVMNIVFLFSKEFMLLIIIAFAIASPVAYYIMHSWLSDFAYRIDIAFWVFILAIFATVFIASLTVGYRAIIAAVANPVKSLRAE